MVTGSVGRVPRSISKACRTVLSASFAKVGMIPPTIPPSPRSVSNRPKTGALATALILRTTSGGLYTVPFGSELKFTNKTAAFGVRVTTRLRTSFSGSASKDSMSNFPCQACRPRSTACLMVLSNKPLPLIITSNPVSGQRRRMLFTVDAKSIEYGRMTKGRFKGSIRRSYEDRKFSLLRNSEAAITLITGTPGRRLRPSSTRKSKAGLCVATIKSIGRWSNLRLSYSANSRRYSESGCFARSMNSKWRLYAPMPASTNPFTKIGSMISEEAVS